MRPSWRIPSWMWLARRRMWSTSILEMNLLGVRVDELRGVDKCSMMHFTLLHHHHHHHHHHQICHWIMACLRTCLPRLYLGFGFFTQDCSKGIRKSKGENFRRRPRSSAEGQGWCPTGTVGGWVDGMGIVEVHGLWKSSDSYDHLWRILSLKHLNVHPEKPTKGPSKMLTLERKRLHSTYAKYIIGVRLFTFQACTTLISHPARIWPSTRYLWS